MAEAESAVPDVVIYTTMWCPYCHRAKSLLAEKGVAFHEIDVTYDPDKRAEMSARAEGRTSVPQIFIRSEPIGGSEELAALEAAGKLDQLLGRAA
ncbi:MAG TPA: glutaredoxin 3 [Alphaproteobacteria bacterium]|nr:glutaredoxin 3 [Alphaproteobacteria bacterium]